MKKVTVMAMGLLLLSSLTAAAKDTHRVKLYNDGKLNGTDVKAGEYRLEVDGANATFFKGNKEVARAVVREEKGEKKIDRNSVLYRDGSITEIRIAGKDSKLVLGDGVVASRPTEKRSKTN